MKRTVLSICAIHLVLLAIGAEAQFFSIGTCPIVTPKTPLVPVLIARRWFEFSRTPSINEHGLRCVTGSVTFNNAFSIRYSARVKLTDIRVNLNGNAVFVAGNNVGALEVNFNNNRFPFFRSKSQVFTIIENDGTVNQQNVVTADPTFMTLYTCKNIGFARLETSYVLTTLRVPAPATVAAAVNTLAVRDLPTGLKPTDQTNC